MSRTVELVCAREACGSTFDRDTGEHNRSVRLDRPEFCSRSCQAVVANTGRVGSANHLPHGRGFYRDELSPFRSYLRSIRRRDPGTDLDLEYLKALWEEQGGRCVLSGWELRLPETSAGQGPTTPRTASIDRIDGAVGYRRGNVRWLALMANLARNGFTDEDVVSFAAAVSGLR